MSRYFKFIFFNILFYFLNFIGRLNNLRNRTLVSETETGSRCSTGSKNSLDKSSFTISSSISGSNSTSSRYPSFSNNSNQSSNVSFGPTYYRRMCVYVLRLQNAIQSKLVWYTFSYCLIK